MWSLSSLVPLKVQVCWLPSARKARTWSQTLQLAERPWRPGLHACRQWHVVSTNSDGPFSVDSRLAPACGPSPCIANSCTLRIAIEECVGGRAISLLRVVSLLQTHQFTALHHDVYSTQQSGKPEQPQRGS